MVVVDRWMAPVLDAIFGEGEVPSEPQSWIAMDVFQPRMNTDPHGWNGDVGEPRNTRNTRNRRYRCWFGEYEVRVRIIMDVRGLSEKASGAA